MSSDRNHSFLTVLNSHKMREISLFTNENKTFVIIGYYKIESLQIVYLEEISACLNVYNIHAAMILLFINKSSWITPRTLLSAIVHDCFFDRGVPGSADMIPSASEPVFCIFIILNFRKKSTGNLYKK